MNRITYISESTRQLMQGSAEVQELASVAYRTAVSLEEKLHRFSLLTSSIEQNGICVSVEESEKLDCYNTSIRLYASYSEFLHNEYEEAQKTSEDMERD